MHSGDDCQRALRTGQKAGEVVARVVLAQPGNAPHHCPVSQDRLEPQHLIAHRSVAQHVHAARVGAYHPADRCRIARSHVDADIPARVSRTGAYRVEDRAGFDHDLTMSVSYTHLTLPTTERV